MGDIYNFHKDVLVPTKVDPRLPAPLSEHPAFVKAPDFNGLPSPPDEKMYFAGTILDLGGKPEAVFKNNKATGVREWVASSAGVATMLGDQNLSTHDRIQYQAAQQGILSRPSGEGGTAPPKRAVSPHLGGP